MSGDVVIAVRVTPRSNRDAVEGTDESGAIRVRVTAPPADGAANKAVTRLLARTLGLPKSAVSLESGATSRHKRLRLTGLSARDVLRHWPDATVSER